MNLTARDLADSDLPTITPWVRHASSDRWVCADILLDELGDTQHRSAWLACDDGVAVAVVLVEPLSQPSGHADLTIVVNPARRGRGVGAAALTAVIAAAGVTTAYATVDQDNHASLRMCERVGFIVTDDADGMLTLALHRTADVDDTVNA
jgi:RimJ/RimL family protein N-acetyltransferase